jgi:hypothetical protein
MNSTDTHRDSAGRAAGAVNWSGDVSTLPVDQLLERQANIANYTCAMLAGPPKGTSGFKSDKAEAARALALWVATRDELLAR